jgi:tetratricopeptide (TPR) repeat protein
MPTIHSMISFLLGGTTLANAETASLERASDGFLSGSRAAALTGLALLSASCSSYEGTNMTTTFLSLTGGAVGLASLVFFVRNRRSSPPPAPSSAKTSPQSEGNHENGTNVVDGRQAEIDGLTKLIDLNPNDASAYHKRGRARERTGDRQKAMEDFDRAIALDPTGGRFFLSRGSAKVDGGDFQGAIEDFDRAVAIDEGLARGYFFRAQAKEGLGLLEDAKSDYELAKKTATNDVIGIFADRKLKELRAVGQT